MISREEQRVKENEYMKSYYDNKRIEKFGIESLDECPVCGRFFLNLKSHTHTHLRDFEESMTHQEAYEVFTLGTRIANWFKKFFFAK